MACWIRHFSYTANSQYRWRKDVRIRGKSVSTAKLSGFKSFRIKSSHFRFRIQNLRRHEQTGMFLFRIRPPVCKRQNQSDTRTFRIHDDSRTISSSVNLVFVFRDATGHAKLSRVHRRSRPCFVERSLMLLSTVMQRTLLPSTQILKQYFAIRRKLLNFLAPLWLLTLQSSHVFLEGFCFSFVNTMIFR